jgi:hypothetical protein
MEHGKGHGLLLVISPPVQTAPCSSFKSVAIADPDVSKSPQECGQSSGSHRDSLPVFTLKGLRLVLDLGLVL